MTLTLDLWLEEVNPDEIAILVIDGYLPEGTRIPALTESVETKFAFRSRVEAAARVWRKDHPMEHALAGFP